MLRPSIFIASGRARTTYSLTLDALRLSARRAPYAYTPCNQYSYVAEMAGRRGLPERKNPLLEPTEATARTYSAHRDQYAKQSNTRAVEILVERRRLGQTNLAVKPGIAGVASATKSDNLGTFDYAHLRVPLPKDLSGSGIFTLSRNSTYPESYFLMVRLCNRLPCDAARAMD